MLPVLLAVDIGNTSVKLSIFEGEKLKDSLSVSEVEDGILERLIGDRHVDAIVSCRVGKDSNGVVRRLVGLPLPFMNVDADTPLPMEVRYKSRASLGIDRIAAAIGAVKPGESGFVADAGTALTADIVIKGVYCGGNISPGLSLRFRSLHEFTSLLPLVKADGPFGAFGEDTDSAIRSGVVGGLLAELEKDYFEAKKIDENIEMILTGGDAVFLHDHLLERGYKARICRCAVGLGLVRIFNYNNSL